MASKTHCAFSRSAFHILAFLIPLALVSCKGQSAETINLQVGPDQIIRFVPKTAHALYFELPSRPDQLRIILASYSMGCHEYRPPPEGEVFVTITLRVPAESKIKAGNFVWRGLPVLNEEDEGVNDEESELDSEEDSEEEDPSATALPFVRLAKEGRLLLPGGELVLDKFEPETFGVVEGKLAFRDTIKGQVPRTALHGSFSLRLCHAILDPARAVAPSKKSK